jgi:hypothetical protein
MLSGHDFSVFRGQQSHHGRLDAEFTLGVGVLAIKVRDPEPSLLFRHFDEDVFFIPFVNGDRSGGFISTAGTLIVLALVVPVILPSASLLVVSVILTWFLSLILSSGIPGGRMGRQTLFESNFSLGFGIIAVLCWASSWAWRSRARTFHESIFFSALLSASR